MHAIINGTTQFSASPVYETYSNGSYGAPGGLTGEYLFTAIAADSSFITLGLPPRLPWPQPPFFEGSDITYYDKHGGQEYTNIAQSGYATGPGFIEVTSLSSDAISGTFNATLYSTSTSDSVIIGNGAFSMCPDSL